VIRVLDSGILTGPALTMTGYREIDRDLVAVPHLRWSDLNQINPETTIIRDNSVRLELPHREVVRFVAQADDFQNKFDR